MQITTKFNIGDSVVFLHRNCFTRRVVSRIEIEASTQDGKESFFVRYYFSDLERGFNDPEPTYKYENEVAATKEDLAKFSQEF